MQTDRVLSKNEGLKDAMKNVVENSLRGYSVLGQSVMSCSQYSARGLSSGGRVHFCLRVSHPQ